MALSSAHIRFSMIAAHLFLSFVEFSKKEQGSSLGNSSPVTVPCEQRKGVGEPLCMYVFPYTLPDPKGTLGSSQLKICPLC